VIKAFRQNPRIALLSLLFVFIFMLPLLLVAQGRENASKQTANLPLIELVNFRFLEISSNGSDKVVLGALGYHFKGLEKISGLEFFQKDGTRIESFSAKNAQKSGDFVYFDGDIVCKNAKGESVKAQKATYNASDKSLTINSKFQIESKGYFVNGENLRLWDENKKLSAHSVRAKFFTENR